MNKAARHLSRDEPEAGRMEPSSSPATVYPPVDDQLLAEVVRRVLTVGRPLRIVLFGSRARGDFKPDSDLDILIVERSNDQLETLLGEYRDALRSVYPDRTVLAYSLATVERWKFVPAHITTQALSYGKVLYEDADIARISADLQAGGGLVCEPSEYKTPEDLGREWFEIGNEDLQVCHIVINAEGPYRQVCYHVQQAIEKYLKGLLALHGIVPAKTHQLDDLLRRLKDVVAIPEFEHLVLKALSDNSIAARYDYSFAADEHMVEDALERALQVIDVVLANAPVASHPGVHPRDCGKRA